MSHRPTDMPIPGYVSENLLARLSAIMAEEVVCFCRDNPGIVYAGQESSQYQIRDVDYVLELMRDQGYFAAGRIMEKLRVENV
tara:strand:+ start:154 stop:402 length:249 start_codon:yes stop_codon:yes gene_type:complete